MELFAIILVVGFVAYGLWREKDEKRRTALAAYRQALETTPDVVHDFTTPEGAIRCLEDAFRRRDLEAAIAAKDFMAEARVQLIHLQMLDPDEQDEEGRTEALAQILRAEFDAAFESFCAEQEQIESYFADRQPYLEGIVAVTHMCFFPDGKAIRADVLVADTRRGWRVLQTLSDDERPFTEGRNGPEPPAT